MAAGDKIRGRAGPVMILHGEVPDTLEAPTRRVTPRRELRAGGCRRAPAGRKPPVLAIFYTIRVNF
jgi:hypothetical protein